MYCAQDFTPSLILYRVRVVLVHKQICYVIDVVLCDFILFSYNFRLFVLDLYQTLIFECCLMINEQCVSYMVARTS